MRNKNIDWDQQPLGQMTDAALARLLDVDVSSVCQARTRRKIGRFRKARLPAIAVPLEHLGFLRKMAFKEALTAFRLGRLPYMDIEDAVHQGLEAAVTYASAPTKTEPHIGLWITIVKHGVRNHVTYLRMQRGRWMRAAELQKADAA